MSEADRKQTVLVTGSSGFLGQHIVRMLHENDDTVGEIRCYDIKPYQNNLQHKIAKEMQITTADIRNQRQLATALKGVDVVIHCAALIDIEPTANAAEMHSVNVEGTQKLVDAAIESNVPFLINISGTDVVMSKSPIYYGTENTTFVPKNHFLAPYSKTKQEAEEIVKDANGRSLSNGKKLQTLSLRPNIMFGEEDTHFLPKVFEVAKKSSGVLRRIDNVFIRIQPVYVGNVANAAILAKNKIQVDDSVGGEAFFITDDNVHDPFEFIETFLKPKGYSLSQNAYPFWIFIVLLTIYSWLINFLPNFLFVPLTATTTQVRLISTTFFFNPTKAILRLNYEPIYNVEQALERSLPYYKRIQV